ncbi:MAG: Rpn family recombination-promoting nuclease/putative transposase [Planctomycetes bacterium]|nr:Rpn family recombination-promoting nuclease/putative transposase [Planctomycetota bacterium]
MTSIHDSSFLDTFGNPEHAVPLLRAILPTALVEAIDWTTLRPLSGHHIDQNQHTTRKDMLFECLIHGHRWAERLLDAENLRAVLAAPQPRRRAKAAR